ncbi:DUF5996 family protein [Daejeonella oryzae]|uniref:DUF5996 family protein n=1 Tax=Daejeonella oryzae TaxID=1122943 RepID=UPI0004006786|nr:DUF5996 family protein [Daejeonella oryzae]
MNELYPLLPLDDWEPTKKTLHLYFQIAGKIRMKLMPKKNHWWHVTLFVSAKGLTTRPIPYRGKVLEIEFNFIDHLLEVRICDGRQSSFKLENGLSVAGFYKKLMKILNDFRIEVKILAKPYDNLSTEPFENNNSYNHYDSKYVEAYWQILKTVNTVFEDFSGRFLGKCCPVHLYWHHMDLTVTRFSGKRGPDMEQADRVEKEAYSHEVISFGFWAGDENVRYPAFYSYTYPSPEGIDKEKLQPESAQWILSNNSPMALLPYDDLRKEDDPYNALLDFLESSYRAGAKNAHWDIEDLANK